MDQVADDAKWMIMFV